MPFAVDEPNAVIVAAIVVIIIVIVVVMAFVIVADVITSAVANYFCFGILLWCVTIYFFPS